MVKENKRNLIFISLVVLIILLLIFLIILIKNNNKNVESVEKQIKTSEKGTIVLESQDRYKKILEKISKRDELIIQEDLISKTSENTNSIIENLKKEGIKTNMVEFLLVLKEEGLLLDDDSFNSETKSLKIGKLSDGNYSYEIILKEENRIIADEKIKQKNNQTQALEQNLKPLPIVPYENTMKLKIKTFKDNEDIHIPVYNAESLQISWGDSNLSFAKINTHKYAKKGEYIVSIIGKTINGYFGGDKTYFNKNIIELIDWGENGFTKFNSFGQNITGKIPIPKANTFKNTIEFSYTFANSLNLREPLPSDIFSTLRNDVYFNQTFSSCVNLTGNAPEIWQFKHIKINSKETFKNCILLENFDEIPNNMK